MPETQTFYKEGADDYSYARDLYNNIPVMRDANNFNDYRNGHMSFVNYWNQWAPQRIIEPELTPIERNVELLAIPQTIFPKRIISLSQVSPPVVVTNVTQQLSMNPSGTFQGDKFRWFGTLQQIQIPVSRALKYILAYKNWMTGGVRIPNLGTIAADPNARVGDYAQTSGVVMTQVQARRVNGNQSSTTFIGEIFPLESHNAVTNSNADKYTLTTSNQIIQPQMEPDYTEEDKWVYWDEQQDIPVQRGKYYSSVKFPMLMSPQFKPWVCFRLITIKFKVSMNEWFQMSNDLKYRLNTLFWNDQMNVWEVPSTILSQWDRATSNSILARPNPYGGTFKICKNKKIYVNPFKGKTITNRIYSKKRNGKIINAKMWQAGQQPIPALAEALHPQFGYYSNGLYVSLLLGPLNLKRDFDSFTASVLREYFPCLSGSQEQLQKASYNFRKDVDNNNNPLYYEKLTKGRIIPGFPNWLNNYDVPYGIQLFGQGDIYIKTQTKYCEY